MPDNSIEVTVSEDEIIPDPQSPEADAGNTEAVGEDLIAGKFKTQDDLLKAYKELESRLGAGETDAQETDAEAADAEPAPDRPDGTIDTSEPEPEPFTLADAAEELTEKGEISDETYARLEEEKGLSKADVDTWAEGIRARGDQMANDLKEAAGGQEQFNQLLDWARSGLEASEIQAYNDAVSSGNATVAKMLLRSMRAAYVDANGRDPNLVGGENVPQNTGAKPFASMDQLTAAMGDERYKTDPVYRRKVNARVIASDLT